MPSFLFTLSPWRSHPDCHSAWSPDDEEWVKLYSDDSLGTFDLLGEIQVAESTKIDYRI